MVRSSAIARVSVILVAGLMALWIATGVTLNLAFARSATALARAIWPVGVSARVIQGKLLISGPQATMAMVDRERVLLRDAALRDPIDTQALGTLAVLEEYRGDRAKARKLFLLSEAMSRRNTLSQFWLIEDSVTHGNVPEAIRHYDRAMRVSVDARTALLPVLVQASSDPNILKALLPVLAQRPLWWKDYLNKLATSGTDPNVMASALQVTRPDLRNSDQRFLAESMLRRMIALKDGAGATLAANRLDGVAGSTRSLQAGNFETADNVLPFAWWLKDDGSIRAYRDTVPTGSLGLRIETSAGASGPVAQQFVGLRPGRYVFKGIAGDVSKDATARPTVELACGNGQRFARFTLPSAGEKGRGFRFAFEVPATGCAVQWVMFVTAPAIDTSIWLDDLAIVR